MQFRFKGVFGKRKKRRANGEECKKSVLNLEVLSNRREKLEAIRGITKSEEKGAQKSDRDSKKKKSNKKQKANKI